MSVKPEGESCIVHQFGKMIELNETEINLLSALEKEVRLFKAGERLSLSGDYSDRFYTLKSGWACAIKTLADGQRQVLDIFLPGQIIGLREIGLSHSLSEFRALTTIEVCPFPKQRLTEIFEQSVRLTDLFFLIMAREQAMLIERIINIGRRNATERLAHFIVEMKTRLNQRASEFHMPINQSIIGDTLGISSVHVSRTFKYLRDLGYIEKNNGQIEIKNLEGLIELSGFDRTYLESTPVWTRLRSSMK
ncbi:MAG TPA: Crp/Fnr family transcriptional regulator [Methylophaga aminisulfidivorans]|uniref:Crp/Fnr family transcriptional regulator n=1 Tax=Methylophaga aminisulfidivorans TaxID=230105 RepID=A0A7C1VRQ3_9GAMM|nr:Crp/Fnr family transcriptional regulator [Methylophaga aminisulfidivorans]